MYATKYSATEARANAPAIREATPNIRPDRRVAKPEPAHDLRDMFLRTSWASILVPFGLLVLLLIGIAAAAALFSK
ncbi:MAG: hypothetical protein JWM21_914 [Acidobacteria bacterium]|nr:hypothetical protein [Acidobacteriota bacterium]